MMKKRGKKGLSTIVATLLIILLTLVAVGIIWIVVRNVIQGGSEQISLGRFTLDLKISQVQKINDSALNVTIKRNVGDGDFFGIAFIAEDDFNKETVKKNVSMNELDIKRFQLYFTTINVSRLKKISISPVFRLESGKEVNGDVEDEYKVGSIDVNGIIEEETPPEDSCIYNSDCTTDYNSSTLCFNNDVYKTFHNFSCVSETCADSTSQILHQDCSLTQECINGACVSPPESCGAGTCGSGEYCFTEAGICLLQVSGNTYFVATNGNDNNNGSFNAPFASFQKAINVSLPGDITYFRGGIYYPNNKILIDPGSLWGNNGTKDNPIHYFNYPNERPIFNFINYNQAPNMAGNSYATGMLIRLAGNLQFKGFDIQDVHQIDLYTEVTAIYSQYSYNLLFENVAVHDCGGRGFMHETAIGYFGIIEDNTSFINCDAYNLADIIQYTEGATPGNQADGFKTYGEPGANFVYEGCRAWNVSDDGFDLGSDTIITIDNCWSFNNGYLEGDGTGFKTGGMVHDNADTIMRIVTNNIAANNIAGYFLLEYEDYYRTNAKFYNNLAYANNGTGYFFSRNSLYPTVLAVYRNNIAYNNFLRPFGNAYQQYTESNNTWDRVDGYPGFVCIEYPEGVFTENGDLKASNADFVSLDVSQLNRPRKADGSLPDVTFGHLAEGSYLIDAGIDVGLPYSGSAPDIGAFETNY